MFNIFIAKNFIILNLLKTCVSVNTNFQCKFESSVIYLHIEEIRCFFMLSKLISSSIICSPIHVMTVHINMICDVMYSHRTQMNALIRSSPPDNEHNIQYYVYIKYISTILFILYLWYNICVISKGDKETYDNKWYTIIF